MLQNYLTEIKGRLLEYCIEMNSNMCSYQDEGKSTKTDYEDFFDASERVIRDILAIKNVADLDKFCEEWGLNDMGGDLSFPELAKKYIAVPVD